MLFAVCTVMLQEEVDMVADDINGVPVGGAGQDLVSNSTVHLKNHS